MAVTKKEMKLKKIDPNLIDVDIVYEEGYEPVYSTEGAACADLKAKIPDAGDGRGKVIVIPSKRSATIDTGIKIQVPRGFKFCVVARSGLAQRGLIVVNAPGQIDDDYRGEVKIAVANIGGEIIEIRDGDRIAQCYVEPVYRMQLNKVDALKKSVRGEGGFGSTGVETFAAYLVEPKVNMDLTSLAHQLTQHGAQEVHPGTQHISAKVSKRIMDTLGNVARFHKK